MVMDAPPAFDLDAYRDRIGDRGELTPGLATLERLHLAHATSVPFENLDILLGRPIRLDLEGLQNKLVTGRRGGYCFEQNTLLAAALGRVGFRVSCLAARVRWGAKHVLPRTHMLLKVDLDEGPWLADVGFGGEGLLTPIPLDPGREVRQFHWIYRVVDEGGLWVLQTLREGSWFDLYSFTTEPQYAVDYEVANHFTSTHPSSRFLRGPTVQLPTPEARYILRGGEFIIDRGGEVSRRPVEGSEALLRLLSETFGLDFPPGTRFPLRNPFE
jgi:N-hydroxyarylamine O-acetyltransferase